MLASQKIPAIIFLALFSVCRGYAQHAPMAMDQMGTMSREASGTSWQPDSSVHHGYDFSDGPWDCMLHGYINGIYDLQGGKRGDEKTFSSSMAMFMGQRQWGSGTFGFRTMFSLDPLMGKNGYPLLLQTGETADGKTPLIDRQHPHDLFMELALTCREPITEHSSILMYLGLPGEPALGPPAFMHRVSGMDNPEAPITHHWLDSTHITYGVGTVGYVLGDIKAEGSIFKGREPDQHRWNIETPRFDSYAGRVSYNPHPDWSLQISQGLIHSPEQLEPDVNTRRTTASVIYNQVFNEDYWQTTLAWGRNKNYPGHTLDGFLLESTVCLHRRHTFFVRAERVEKDELFQTGEPLNGAIELVYKTSMGYIYDVALGPDAVGGIGASIDMCVLPQAAEPAYGEAPVSYMIFTRAKL